MSFSCQVTLLGESCCPSWLVWQRSMKVYFAPWNTDSPPRHTLFTPLLSGLSRKVNVSVVSQLQTHAQTSGAHFCVAFAFSHSSWNHFMIAVSTSFSHTAPIASALSPSPTPINCIELPAAYLLPCQPGRETQRLNDGGGGSGGRWEVTGEQP